MFITSRREFPTIIAVSSDSYAKNASSSSRNAKNTQFFQKFVLILGRLSLETSLWLNFIAKLIDFIEILIEFIEFFQNYVRFSNKCSKMWRSSCLIAGIFCVKFEIFKEISRKLPFRWFRRRCAFERRRFPAKTWKLAALYQILRVYCRKSRVCRASRAVCLRNRGSLQKLAFFKEKYQENRGILVAAAVFCDLALRLDQNLQQKLQKFVVFQQNVAVFCAPLRKHDQILQ